MQKHIAFIPLLLLLGAPMAAAAQTWSAPLSASDWKAQPSWLGNPAPAGGYSVARTTDGIRLGIVSPGTGMKFAWTLPAEVDPARYAVAVLRYRAKAVSRQGHYALCFLGAQRTGTIDYEVAIPCGEIVADARWHTVWAELAPTSRKLRTISAVACDVQAAGPNATLEIGEIGLRQDAPAQSAWESCSWKPGAAFGTMRALDLGPSAAPDAKAAAGIQPATDGGITVEGIPFRMHQGIAASSSMAEERAIRVPAGVRASAAYLLVEADMQGTDDAIHGGGKLSAIRDVDRFRIRVTYADGSADETMPIGVPGGLPGVCTGAQVLACPVDGGKRLTGVAVLDRCSQAAFRVLAATVRTDGRRLAREAAPAAGLPERRASTPSSSERSLAFKNSVVTVVAGRCVAVVDLAGAPVMRHLRQGTSGVEMLARPSRLLAVEVDGRPADLRPGQAPHPDHGVVTADYALVGAPGVRLTLRIFPRADGFGAQVSVANGDAASHKVAVSAPTIGPYRLAGSADAEWYLYPKRGAALDNRLCSYNERYSGLFPLQFVDTFAPAAGVGLSLRTEDRGCEQKRYRLEKSAAGLTMGISFATREIAPGAAVELPTTVLTVTDGGATRGMEAYRSWIASWYKPIAPRKPWFRQIANFRQRFLHWLDPLDDGKQIDLRKAIDEAKSEFGGIDYLHLFDWGNAGPFGRSYGRPGDTEPWPYMSGGREGLSKAIAGVRDGGVPVGLYIEGYLLESNGKLGKTEQARQWQIVNAQGTPIFYPESTERFMCPAVEPWRAIEAQTYADAKAALAPSGMYVDEFGFGDEGKDCWSPEHGHPVPSYTVTAEGGMLKRIRDAVGPEVAIYSEETPVDVNSALQDGSFTYAMNQAYGTTTRVPLNTARFCLPGFKTIEILICDQPTGSWATGVRQAFFNGEALWLEGPAKEWFAPVTRETIRRCYAVLRAHRAAFAGDHPQPLIPTLQPGLYANRFEGGGETVYTLYNATPTTIRGGLLVIAGRTVVDAFRSQPASVRRSSAAAVVRGEIGPYDVGCFVVK